jgi:hypothetical protein
MGPGTGEMIKTKGGAAVLLFGRRRLDSRDYSELATTRETEEGKLTEWRGSAGRVTRTVLVPANNESLSIERIYAEDSSFKQETTSREPDGEGLEGPIPRRRRLH